MNTALNKATLRLFNGVYTPESIKSREVRDGLLTRTVRNGYILQPEINATPDLLDTIEQVVGISGEKANNAFHKSWRVIRDTSQETLWLQAALHYITTYGFEYLGVYSDDTVYIPSEQLDLPDVRLDDMPLTVVKSLSRYNLSVKFADLASSGIALSEQTLDDLMVIVIESGFDFRKVVELVTNRELQARMRDYYGIVTSEPVEFLRHVISKLTDESLLIKNKHLIEKIKAANGKFLDELLKDAPADLASIFLRYKPLFLAMKSISRNKTYFNQLRKQANKLHKPLPEDYLNSVTAQIKQQRLNLAKLQDKLEGATIWRKVRLAYALKYRLNQPNSIVYRVRNGRDWVDDFEWSNKHNFALRMALTTVLSSIVDSLRENVAGKTFYIPANVSYTLPATEKQFTGNLPTGSYVTVPQDLIVGIHWTDTEYGRVDIDLSTVSISGKIGWDLDYRSSRSDVLFSGDMTSAPAPKGATELFYVRQAQPETYLLMANYFNYAADNPVTCKLLAAHEQPKNFGENYMVDISNIVASANIEITQKQSILGLIANIGGEQRVYFANVAVGNAISSRNNKLTDQAREYLVSSVVNSIMLDGVLMAAGAKVVYARPLNADAEYVDLSPDALDKTTIINLMIGN